MPVIQSIACGHARGCGVQGAQPEVLKRSGDSWSSPLPGPADFAHQKSRPAPQWVVVGFRIASRRVPGDQPEEILGSESCTGLSGRVKIPIFVTLTPTQADDHKGGSDCDTQQFLAQPADSDGETEGVLNVDPINDSH